MKTHKKARKDEERRNEKRGGSEDKWVKRNSNSDMRREGKGSEVNERRRRRNINIKLLNYAQSAPYTTIRLTLSFLFSLHIYIYNLI